MAIKEIELYYGVVFSRLANCGVPLSIEPLTYETKGIYLTNRSLPLYIKYTSKRLSPWHFSFTVSHQDDLQKAKLKFGSAFLIFVCGYDGICCLEFDQFKQVLDHVHENTEWVRIARKKKESYSISGTDGELKGKISDSDFPRVILSKLKLSGAGSSLNNSVSNSGDIILNSVAEG